VSYGITLSSGLSRISYAFFNLTPLQLRLQEGNWICRIEKSRSYVLHELSPPILVLHTLFPQGEFASVLDSRF
jgi:hypothetical protein